MKKKIIEEKVVGLLSQHGYNVEQDNHVNIVDFVKEEGFSVRNTLLPDNEDGFLTIRPTDDKYDKIIGVNINRSIESKRFIIAHEFAHSVLHYESGQIFLHRENETGKDSEENDADYFAAALLMPFKSFKRIYVQLKMYDLSKRMVYLNLAMIYRVPIESVVKWFPCQDHAKEKMREPVFSKSDFVEA